jgi:signal transduction histidine kinase
MIRRLKSLSDRDWDVLDKVLAAVVLVVLAVDLTATHRHESLALELVIAAAIAAGLAVRRRHPLWMAVIVVTGCGIVLTTFRSPANGTSVGVVMIFASYSTGAHLELRRALIGFALTTGAIATVCIIKTPGDIFFPVVFFGIAPWVLGRVIRTQTALARELTERAEREQIAREHEEARATAAERARVARELHDVLAHNLSVMVIQASGARRIVDKDPAAAVEAARLISRTGREALNELRYVFGPVRREDGDALDASPGLANLGQLASRAHRAGLPVDLHVDGIPQQLSPGADLAAYRVVQEALTNTIKHAHAARATVNVRYGPGDVVVEVLDDGTGATGNGKPWENSGHGLVGMRERMALYGGDLEAGRLPSGGFSVCARLPLRGAAA